MAKKRVRKKAAPKAKAAPKKTPAPQIVDKATTGELNAARRRSVGKGVSGSVTQGEVLRGRNKKGGKRRNTRAAAIREARSTLRADPLTKGEARGKKTVSGSGGKSSRPSRIRDKANRQVKKTRKALTKRQTRAAGARAATKGSKRTVTVGNFTVRAGAGKTAVRKATSAIRKKAAAK